MRPEFQLFLHVAGATALFGAIATLCVLGLSAGRVVAQGLLARAALVTTIAVGVPSWIVMLAFGSWTKSKEGLSGSIGWLSTPIAIAGAGIFVLLAAAALSYAWWRRPASSWQPLALGVISGGYIVALGVAWWMMTAKVG
ncbi:MAG TPA: hypothetical protein VH063_03440 [Gaiellaceae bacterium]|jgi:hypothetical protein|nr:hypothetical protein [Gaiellaceae bacterium]